MSKKFLFILILSLLLIAGGLYYWFFYMNNSALPRTPGVETTPTFTPFGRGTVTPPKKTGVETATSTPDSVAPSIIKLPTLRQLSTAPTGGFMASSTASSTVVRYIDRGVGHVYEVSSVSNDIRKISNTTIPKVYTSFWNKDMSALVLQSIKDSTDTTNNYYADIRPTKTSASSTNEMPYDLKGKFISSTIRDIAVSPKYDKIFTFSIENERGIGYISGFDESKKTKIFDIPLTQVNIEWPEENTLAVTTKGSGLASGYLYTVDIKKGITKKILGGIPGLSTKVSADAKNVLYSSTNQNGVALGLFSIKNATSKDLTFKTFADKCVWSKMHPEEIYCAVPRNIPEGLYPDDWYRGNTLFTDEIWYLDTLTGDIQLIANLLSLSNNLIDATNLTLDPKENFLYFINKRDLTLWSLDLNN